MSFIKSKDIWKALEYYDKYERRAIFFDLSKKLINKKFEIEGYILLMAIWNFAAFRYVTKDFDLVLFRNKIKKVKPLISKFKNKNFLTINFDDFKNELKIIFDELSSIKGIGFTGASKLMHLMNENVFVMWDRYIRKEAKKEHYNFCTSSYKKITPEGFKKDSDDYLRFLKEMQDMFKNTDFEEFKPKYRHPTKIIDVYNYVNITMPIQLIEKEEKRIKKENKNLS